MQNPFIVAPHNLETKMQDISAPLLNATDSLYNQQFKRAYTDSIAQENNMKRDLHPYGLEKAKIGNERLGIELSTLKELAPLSIEKARLDNKFNNLIFDDKVRLFNLGVHKEELDNLDKILDIQKKSAITPLEVEEAIRNNNIQKIKYPYEIKSIDIDFRNKQSDSDFKIHSNEKNLEAMDMALNKALGQDATTQSNFTKDIETTPKNLPEGFTLVNSNSEIFSNPEIFKGGRYFGRGKNGEDYIELQDGTILKQSIGDDGLVIKTEKYNGVNGLNAVIANLSDEYLDNIYMNQDGQIFKFNSDTSPEEIEAIKSKVGNIALVTKTLKDDLGSINGALQNAGLGNRQFVNVYDPKERKLKREIIAQENRANNKVIERNNLIKSIKDIDGNLIPINTQDTNIYNFIQEAKNRENKMIANLPKEDLNILDQMQATGTLREKIGLEVMGLKDFDVFNNLGKYGAKPGEMIEEIKGIINGKIDIDKSIFNKSKGKNADRELKNFIKIIDSIEKEFKNKGIYNIQKIDNPLQFIDNSKDKNNPHKSYINTSLGVRPISDSKFITSDKNIINTILSAINNVDNESILDFDYTKVNVNDKDILDKRIELSGLNNITSDDLDTKGNWWNLGRFWESDGVRIPYKNKADTLKRKESLITIKDFMNPVYVNNLDPNLRYNSYFKGYSEEVKRANEIMNKYREFFKKYPQYQLPQTKVFFDL